MARRGRALRNVAAYAQAEASGGDWMHVTAALQERLLREAGVEGPRMAAALHVLRSAASLFDEDALAAHGALPLYVRHNRATAGLLCEGDTVPAGLTLHDLDGRRVNLATTLGDHPGLHCRPTLLVAGSWS